MVLGKGTPGTGQQVIGKSGHIPDYLDTWIPDFVISAARPDRTLILFFYLLTMI